nr:hypothetical protein [Tanacetum cinerariifolium]
MADDGGGTTAPTTVLCGGGRQRFEVELIPGETTIVSWKKLMKDANKAAAAAASASANNQTNKADDVNNNTNNKEAVGDAPVAVAVKPPALDSRIAPVLGEAAENEGNDVPNGSRFNAVIEKIERLYMGKNSSDEEDLNDVPDDDEYDTEDSFIDDTELDDYFQVDNSAIKHDGFFVNRGTLERANEPPALPTEQPKKRRRKDPSKGDGGSNDGQLPNKPRKVSKKEAKKVVASADKNPITPSRSITLPTVNQDDLKYQSTVIALGTVVKKADSKITKNPSPTRVLNGEAKVAAKNIDKQKTVAPQSKKQVSKVKDGSPALVRPSQMTADKGADVSKSQGQLSKHPEELKQSKDKNLILPQADTKAFETPQQPKTAHMVRKEGSSAKPKSANIMLDKAIKDLEKTVAETRPPSMEIPEADNSSQAVKKRISPEIKQKLAKVARLAHSIHGKHTTELLNRLMGILGHLIQLRSLKRNLQNMVVTGMSAKEEKDAKVQQLKKEVDEMVKIRAPMMKPAAIEQTPGSSSDDFQETSTKEKALKSRFTTDHALEDKIFDLCDLFIEGLDEDASPQLRKLYAELAEMWPKGCMDNHGIKRAIERAKGRRKALNNDKDQENVKKKKLPAPKTETVTVDVGSVCLAQRVPHKLVTDSSAPMRSISNTMAASAAAGQSNSAKALTVDRPKQEKLKGSSSNQNNSTGSEALVKKKVKRKPEAVLDAGQPRPQKLTSAEGEEKRKSNKQMTGDLVQPSVQPPITPAITGGQPAQPVVNSSVDMI